MKMLDEQGFLVMQEVLCPSAVIALRQNIKKQLQQHAQEIDVPLSAYFYCTGRWASPSRVTQHIDEESNSTLQQKLHSLLGKQIVLQKSNIICKNQSIKEAVPLHQDISYSPNAPYHYSLWLALDDVEARSGALQFILGSHNWPISPAVDFWSPAFHVNKKRQHNYNPLLRQIYLKQGDAVLFDSRLWHGSLKSRNGNDRYAYVTRWIMKDHPFSAIPSIQPAYFGMWNCHHITTTLLKKALPYYSLPAEDTNFIELIVMWTELIRALPSDMGLDKNKIARDLYHLQILHQAANTHNAGDLTGRIYKNLWYSLLLPLKASLNI
jgi:hypothetical protein